MPKRHIGSRRDDLLKAEGTFDQAQALAVIEAKLLEGLTDPETAMTAADWKALRQEALASVQGRSKKP